MSFDSFSGWLETDEKASNFLDGNECIFFFWKDDKPFGTDEDSRLAFARLKSGEEPDANFSAIDLDHSFEKEKKERIFGAKDLPHIKIAERQEIIRHLKGKS